MFSLEHGVNLSRRACRAVLLVLLLAGPAPCLPKPPNHAADTLMHSQGDPDNYPLDVNVLLQSGFSPRPSRSEPDVAPTEATAPSQATKEEKVVERYHISSVNFSRVETPFIIGLWIFCASLAKIGMECDFCLVVKI